MNETFVSACQPKQIISMKFESPIDHNSIQDRDIIPIYCIIPI